jgi:hypothetical protein
MSFGSFQGQSGHFRRFWGNLWNFRVAGGPWCKRTRALAKFEDFLVIFWNFGGFGWV